MSKQLPDLWDGCYDGEHRKLLAPEQFKQMFCKVCLNPGCRNSRGAGSKWNQRMLTQEDRLLNNPAFAPETTADIMGLPDFKNMIQDALRVEISTKKNDWEPVTEAEIGRAAAEMMGLVPPSGFEPSDPGPIPEDPTPEDPRIPEGQWRVRGDSLDKSGKPLTYTVTLWGDGGWECNCPSRDNPCKHSLYIKGRISNSPKKEETPNPVIPPSAPRKVVPKGLNTSQPSEGIMVGGPNPEPISDPWAAPKVKERKIEVGGKVTFGKGEK